MLALRLLGHAFPNTENALEMQPTVERSSLVPQFNVTSHNPETSHCPRFWINTHYPILNNSIEVLTSCLSHRPPPITFRFGSPINSPTWACPPSDSIRAGLCTPSQPHRLYFCRTTLNYRLSTVQFSQAPPTSISGDSLQNDHHSPRAFPAFEFG